MKVLSVTVAECKVIVPGMGEPSLMLALFIVTMSWSKPLFPAVR